MMKGLVWICLMIFSVDAVAQEKRYPVIKEYGEVSDIPLSAFKADPSLQYKVVIEVSKSDTLSPEINPSLEAVARLVNLLAMEGISRNNMDIVVVFHNAGTYCIQKNDAYNKKYGMNNPNLAIFDRIAKAGVKFYVCGQSTVKRKVKPEEIVSEVAMATSYMTIFTTLQLKGYAVLHL